jgi:hypothetical protein
MWVALACEAVALAKVHVETFGMNICEDAPVIAQGRELQEASPALEFSATFCRLFSGWHEVGTLLKNGLSTYMLRLPPFIFPRLSFSSL